MKSWITVNKEKGDFEDAIQWTEFRGTKKEKSLTGKIVQKLKGGVYEVERVEYIKQVTRHVVHLEKVDRIER